MIIFLLDLIAVLIHLFSSFCEIGPFILKLDNFDPPLKFWKRRGIWSEDEKISTSMKSYKKKFLIFFI